MRAAFVARSSIPTILFLLMVVATFAAIAVLGPQTFGLTPKAGWETIRWPTALIGSLATIFFVLRLFDRQPRIVVDDEGLLIRDWSDDVIPWSSISRWQVAGRRWLTLYLKDPQRYPPRSLRSRLFGRGWNMGLGDIAIGTTGLDCQRDELVSAIGRYAPASLTLASE